MADEGDLIFKIELDNEAALRSLKQFSDEATKAGESGNEAMQEMGKGIGMATDDLENMRKQLKNLAAGDKLDLGDLGKELFGKAQIDMADFRQGLNRMFKDIGAGIEDLASKEVVDFTKLVKAPSFGGKATIQQSFEIIGTEEAEQKMESLREVTERMLATTDERARKIGGVLQGLGEHWLQAMQKGGMSTE